MEDELPKPPEQPPEPPREPDYKSIEELRAFMERLDEGMFAAAAEEDIKQSFRNRTYQESFDDRIKLSISFANKKVPEEKVEHVFGTVLNGIKSAYEVHLNLVNIQKVTGGNPELLASFKKNAVDKISAKRLVIRDINLIGATDWPNTMGEMKEIWRRPSVKDPRPDVLWSGGGQQLAEMLGEVDKPFDPFIDFPSGTGK
ncbi:MAG: hypothetical protein UV59_C0012G0072 [Candidatus Gottesmanbacteria bacterium GW2011_GWA1_43_11]|uniref:Uncharacterized protein n=1 Tax=Candidatus Gottesmanbacteria bacterium GW2011_GWA1_43_11 TaxID=1618436 RepID=A0A0G1CHM0_9BACT|nr:MAG: hypothetical protein UV59_C0012G0072 [Candidatus Gottesmanbacteria bacterium GW2011_GWA1_43_11]